MRRLSVSPGLEVLQRAHTQSFMLRGSFSSVQENLEDESSDGVRLASLSNRWFHMIFHEFGKFVLLVPYSDFFRFPKIFVKLHWPQNDECKSVKVPIAMESNPFPNAQILT